MSKSKIRKQIRELIRRYKDRPCQDCGIKYEKSRMSYDHVRGIKRFNLGGSILHETIESVVEEIKKCDILCLGCHKIREDNKKLLRR